MLEVCSYRLELDALRQELAVAWVQEPFPIDEVARLNKRIREVLTASGFTSVPILAPTFFRSPEHRARQSESMKKVWVARHQKKLALAGEH